MDLHKGRFRHGSSILSLVAMALAAFCPVCVFSMFFGAVSLGIGLAMSSYLPVFLGFVVVFSIPFSWRGYQWLKNGAYAKFKIRSFTTLQLTVGTALFMLGLLSQNFIMMGSGYVACLLIPILYKMRLKGHRSIAVLLLFALLSSALLGRVVVASLSPQNDCILCGTTKPSNADYSSIEKLDNGSDGSLITNVDRILGSGKPTFLFFYADWCHFCQKEKPIVEGLKTRYEGKIDFILLNEKDNAEAMQTFGVEAFPTMFLVVEKKGMEYSGFTMSGYTEEQELVSTFDNALANKGRAVPIATVEASSVQISQVSPRIEQPLINTVALSILFLTPAVFWKKRETLKTHLKPKPWIGILLSIIIVCGIFSSLPQLVGGGLQQVEEDSDFDSAMIRALEQTGFGNKLDSVIDKVLSSGRFVFLFFYADWCHFCQQEKPIIAELEPLYSDEIIFIHLNNAKNPEAMEEFGVEGFPTMFLIYGKDNGEYIYQIFNGFTEKTILESVFTSLIENAASLRSIANAQDDGTTDGYVQHSCSTAKCLKECMKQNMHFSASELFSKLMGLLVKCAGFGKARDAFETAYKGAETSECAIECHESMEAAKEGKITDARAEANCFRCAISNALQDIPVIGEELACPLTALERMYDLLATPADCLAECANDPSTWSQDWGHECRDHRSPDRYVCVSPSAKGKLVCDQCEWMVDPKSTLPCPAGTECQETPAGPTCIRECKPSECDDGDSCTVDRCMSAYWGGQGCVHWQTPGCDKPDDSYDVSSISLAESTATYKKPDVGVLSTGFTPILLDMLRNLGLEGASIGASLQGIQDYPVFIIPSGALSGLDTSPTFKSSIAQYVNNGGTLIVFSQQHGYEYQALPSGNLTGFGWLEDQSCQLSSVAVSTYHPIFSGQNSLVLNVNVDGFFTSYPQNSSLLLSRTKNGMPAMLMYNYGYGRVVATTLYSDMASGIYQGTNDEKILIKNLIRWAMTEGPTPSYAPGSFTASINVTNPYPSPVTYPVQELSAGDTVSLQVNVKNPGNTTADKISFIVFDPTANKFWVNVTDTILAGQSKIINLTYQTTASSKSGLWSILYSVSSGTSFICMSYGGEFALNYNVNDLSQLTSFVTVFDPDNNTVLTQNNLSLTVLPGKTGSINFTLNSDKLGIWTARYSVLTKDGKVLISSLSSFAVSKLKENPEGFAYSWANMMLSVTSDQETYEEGSPAVFTFHLWSKENEDKNVTVTWGLAHHSWKGIVPSGWDNGLSKWIIVPANGYASFNYVLPKVVDFDRLRAKFYIDGVEVGYAERGLRCLFVVIETDIETNARTYMRGETVFIGLHLKNNQPIAHDLQVFVQVLQSDVRLYETNFNVSMPAGSVENRTFSFPLPSALAFGTYSVVSEVYYKLVKVGADETYFEVPEHVKKFEFDKSSYRIGETLGITLFLHNNLLINWNPTVNISIPDLPFSDSQHVEIPSGQNRTLSYNLTLPETLHAGRHSVLVRYVEEDITSEFSFAIPESKLELVVVSAQCSAGENLQVSLENVGGVAANYAFQAILCDPYLDFVLEENKTGSIKAGGAVGLSFPISDQAVSGNYFLMYTLKNLMTDKVSNSMEIFYVDGLSASLDSQTDKRIYSVEEVISLFTTIVNLGTEIKGAILNLKIQSTAPAPPKKCVIPYDDLYINEDTILCPGIYSLTDPGRNGLIIINADGITLEGNNTTLVQEDLGYYEIAVRNPGFNDVTIKNIEIKDFYAGVELSSSSNNLVKNVTISSWIRYAMGIYLVQASNNNIVTDNSFHDLWGDAVYLEHANNNTITNNRMSHVGSGNVYLEYSDSNTIEANTMNDTQMMELDYSNENTLTENTFNNTGGIYLYYATGTTISSNSLINGKGDGLFVYESDDSLITNNLVKSNKYGIYLCYSRNNTLIGNTMLESTYNFNIDGDSIEHFVHRIETSNQVDGKPMYYYVGVSDIVVGASTNAGFVGIVNSQRITVRDLVLSKNGQGVLFVNTTDSSITNITAYDYEIAGIDVWVSSYNTISNNEAYTSGLTGDARRNGIRLQDSSYNELSNNTLFSDNYGIRITGGQSNTVAGNNATSNGNGIYVTSSNNNTLTGNKLISNGIGIYLYSYASNNAVTENFVQNCKSGGIYIAYFSTGNTIKGNSVRNPAGYGIGFSYSNNNSLSNNNASGNGSYGIYFSYSTGNMLSNNTANQNSAYGIYLSISGSSTLRNNVMSGNKYNFAVYNPTTFSELVNDIDKSNLVDGKSIYYLIGASNVIIGSSSNAGVVYCMNCNNVTVKDSNLAHNWAGIYLYNSTNTLIQNTKVAYTYYGIYFYRSSGNNQIIGSNVSSSEGYGIFLYYSDNNRISSTSVNQSINGPGISLQYSNSNTVSNCTANSNWHGISLTNSNNNNITGNTFCSNTYYDITASSGSVNSGTGNTCNKPQNWNDQGYPGCTYPCLSGGSTSCTPWPITHQASDEPQQSDHAQPEETNYDTHEPATKLSQRFVQPLSPTHSNSADAMSSASSSSNVIWERNIPVDITDLKEISTIIGKLNMTGKLYLYATLYSSTGQVIATSVYTFYISDQDLSLTLETDKAMYKPGETVKITGLAENTGAARNVTLTIKADGAEIYSQNITLASNGNYTYATNIIASKSLTLEGLLDGVNVTEHVWVGIPSINASIVAPDVVGIAEFNVTISIENTGNITTNLNVAFGTNSWNLTIPAGELKTLSVKMTISEDTVVTVNITGDIIQTLQRSIVLGEKVDVEVTPETVYLEGSVGIPYTVTNTGILDTRFNASFSLNGETITKEIYIVSGTSVSDTVYFNLTKGMYILEYESPFWTNSISIDVESEAKLIVTSMPQNMVFNLGEEANLTVTVKNIGGKAGKAQLHLQSPGLIDEYTEAWVEGGQEINMTFAFMLPDDVEEKNYKLYLDLNGEQYETAFFMEGAKISVTGMLDKPFYREGENATFTLEVENQRDMNLTLFTRVKLGEYDVTVYFNLTGFQNKTLFFSVPVVFNSEKLLYTVYLASGRSLYINSAYIYEEPSDSAGIRLYTDKQVYEAGETAKIFVNATKPGRLIVKTPTLNVNTTLEVGSTLFTFEIPLLRSGTYPLEYSFDNFTSSYLIDIIGYSARIIESSIDKQIYQAEDNLNVNLVIDVNKGFAGQLQVFILNPQDWIVGAIASDHTFTVGENKISLTVPLITNQTGMHSVVFKLYAYGSFIFLSSAARHFDAYIPPDTTPPVIGPVDITNQLDANRPVTEKEPIAVNAIVTDNVNVAQVTLYYRRPGENYVELAMPKCPGCIDTYNNTIPASFVTTSTIEYYINATDGINFATYPATNPTINPKIIPVNLYPAAVVLNQPTDITESSIKLSWTQSTDLDFRNYTIYQSTAQGSLGNAVNMIADKLTTSFTLTGLSANTTYYFMIRVYDTGGLHADSNQVTAKTAAATPPNANVAPTAVTLNPATDVTGSSLKLSWTKNTDADFKRYVTHQSTTAGATGTAVITITDSSLTSCDVTGLSANTTYYFIIRVYDTEGLYADSNQIAVTTLAPVSEPPPYPLIPIAGGLAIAAIIIIIITLFMMKKRKKNPKPEPDC